MAEALVFGRHFAAGRIVFDDVLRSADRGDDLARTGSPAFGSRRAPRILDDHVVRADAHAVLLLEVVVVFRIGRDDVVALRLFLAGHHDPLVAGIVVVLRTDVQLDSHFFVRSWYAQLVTGELR